MQNEVYVLNQKGKPLMSTKRFGHVRKLLNEKKAVPVCNNPFTIRLKYETPDIVQPLTLGIDTGRENIGLGVSSENGSCVYKGEVITQNKNVTKNMSERREHRNARRRHKRIKKQRKAIKSGMTIQNGKEDILRSKKLFKSKDIKYPGMEEYNICKVIKGKEAKFNNRKREEGWITPSARNLVQIHLNSIKLVQKILPIDNIVIERVNFDFQKLENEDIKAWEYAKGPLFGFKDYKEYINEQQHSKCLLCEKGITQYHHICYKSQNGSNSVKNYAGLCDFCHEKVHNNLSYEEILLEKKEGLSKKYSISLLNSCMDIIIEECEKILPTTITTGRETAKLRNELGLEKTHANDAYVISLANKEVSLEKEDIDLPDAYKIRHFKKKSNNNINSLGKRTYEWNGKVVAINRHKAFNQKEDSLEEYMSNYAKTHTKKECNKHFSELTVKPAKRIYTYHKKGIVSKFKCGDKVLYVKKNKIKGKTKRKVFVVEKIKISQEKLEHNGTKSSKMKFCKILESTSLQYIK